LSPQTGPNQRVGHPFWRDTPRADPVCLKFGLKDILTAVGPSASIVFAAWISMGYLQQRYSAALERYRSLIEQCRDGGQAERAGRAT
jgi:hypothetical protein